MVEESPAEFIFVGLGNPGKTYAKTRHNLGFMVLGELAAQQKWSFKEEKTIHAAVARGMLNGKKIHLVLPMVFMNISGQAVREYLHYYHLLTSQLVVVCDDIALEYGQIRFRTKGSAGGHNGLKSIISHLSTNEFMRLRMGIGDNRDEQSLADYVLDNFTAEESTVLAEFVKRGVRVLESLTTNDLKLSNIIRPEI